MKKPTAMMTGIPCDVDTMPIHSRTADTHERAMEEIRCEAPAHFIEEDETMMARVRRFFFLLPWWLRTLRIALAPEWDVPIESDTANELTHMAAVQAMGAIWMRYVSYIPPDRQEGFKLYIVRSLENSIRSTTAIVELMDRRKIHYTSEPGMNSHRV
jgi:hypothetical protein